MKSGGSKGIYIILSLFVAAAGVWLVCLLLAVLVPLKQLDAKVVTVEQETDLADQLNFSWPAQGTAAVGVGGTVKANKDGALQVPIASIAKVITALVVLDKKPISSGELGEQLTMTDKDVALWSKAVEGGQSNVKVEVGEKLTEKDMLNGVMLASANNMAESLAIWAYGSQDEFVKAANAWLQKNGLSDTKMADASGVSAETVSTANDLIKIAKLASENDVLKQTFSQKQASLPAVGMVQNTNSLLGVDGIFGLKTGNTSAAGYGLLFASEIRIDGIKKVVYGVVLGQVDRAASLDAAKELNRSAQGNLGAVTIIKKGAVVGQITSVWGGKVNIVAAGDLTTVTWKDDVVSNAQWTREQDLSTYVVKGAVVGKLATESRTVNAVASDTIYEPNLGWRVTHPF